MNIQALDILITIKEKGYTSQRELSQLCSCSLGAVNKALKELFAEGLLDSDNKPTKKAESLFKSHRPQRAIILAAGVGMRMAPLNTEMPKALLQVHGETLIERHINQLHAAGINEIYVVVGFMKEKFEFLIDQYNIKLIINTEYAARNNLHSLALAKKYLSNAYIVPCDLWCKNNPFSENELYSWYTVSDEILPSAAVRINRKGELVSSGKSGGNKMLGICYLTAEDGEKVRKNISVMDKAARYDGSFWEEALYEDSKLITYSKLVDRTDIVEINTYEQLRELDAGSANLKNDAISTIAKVLKVNDNEILDITALKKGMTNRSFLFSCKGEKYIMRIPGEGTDMLINRKNEAAVYNVLDGKGICDDIIYINPENGYKITKFLDGVRVCDCESAADIAACMKKLREFHNQNLKVDHEFNIFEMIEFYESLWNGIPSDYRDYSETKKNVLSLKSFIDSNVTHKCLTHIDAVPDNFLFVKYESGKESIRLIDWEYAGMQDPHVDIAMFCIYSLYDREHVEALIDAYFTEGCDKATRAKIYCYISACGLLWSNWCEYKRILGVEFGEYSLCQYRFAKEYYKIATEFIAGIEVK